LIEGKFLRETGKLNKQPLTRSSVVTLDELRKMYGFRPDQNLSESDISEMEKY
jgi:hypothetical protein